MGKIVRAGSLYILTGVAAGISSTVFLVLLRSATDFRLGHAWMIWFLPLAGLIIGLAYRFYAHRAAQGSNLVLEEIHNPKNVLPLRMAPLVLGGTLMTHLFGGSAGREGTAVQMAASMADQVGRLFKVTSEERQRLLMAGMGAGFGSAMGAPLAGAIFGMEVIQVGRLRLSAWPQCLLSSLIAYGVSLQLGIPHSSYGPLDLPVFNWMLIPWIFVAGIVFGVAALVFVQLAHFIEKTAKSLVATDFLRPFWGGVLLVFCYQFVAQERYAGLGIAVIQEALVHPAELLDPVFKVFFTTLTLGTGFKGGEFVPLVYIGSTLGSFLGTLLPVSFSLLAVLGFGAVFAGAANTPLACALLTAEIFGWSVFPYALLACYMSYYCSGHGGVYRTQIIARPKHHRMSVLMSTLGKLTKRLMR